MTLQVIWFVLWGVLWAVYFMLDGFDFGAGMLYNFLGRNDVEKKQIVTSIGPVWNGNEVWLITAGGATFAAFPGTYASMFSYLYVPLLLILWSLIIRGVSLEFRGKHESGKWQRFWDRVILAGSALPALLFGVAFGNIFRGLKMDAAGYHGTFLGLLNPYALLSGALFVLLFLHHGALWLTYRTDGEVSGRASRAARVLFILLLVVAAGFLAATAFATRLYNNYLAVPVWFVVPLLAVAALIASRVFAGAGRQLAAFLASCGVVVGVVFTGIIGLFPNLIPSATDPAASLTIFNSSSSAYTLGVMTVVAFIFVPLVIAYQIAVYRFFRHRVTADLLDLDEDAY